ncbi:hypothetical protein IDH50_18415 [Aeromicrobium tamlense]|uniref:G:T-mismatch repair DNA endonuclease (Very short patch repair protein) n=1 Tax=Aeromicrobium tamlense TaxID=375541 RepID=A0A8I0KJM1_9ACTN|nr:hypothetical protein [Aeromicrobium tamlense]MBD1272225.1 hypothetical protein [Aeromicrobium tamlense]NYI38579.1 G:T-mismatch repair DNA endonuclease (very short patch repair protein) [Aeromicrobium tamlense]
MREIPESLTGRPFTVAEARAAGVSARTLDGGRFRRLFRGVHVLASEEPTSRTWLRAAVLAGPSDAVVSHRTAQELCGPELSGADDRIHLSTRRNAVSRDERIAVHRRLHPIASHEVDGLPVTTPARTFVDCALSLTFVQLLVFGDWLIHRGLVEFDELLHYCRGRHLDGVVNARRAMQYLVADARSPMETLVRLMIVLSGLPHPACNVTLLDDAGHLVATPDLQWARFKVVVEYDGIWHERSPDDRRWQRDRREELERRGWTVIVVHDTDLAKPVSIVTRVHDALVRGGYRGPRPVFGPRWHRVVRQRL